MKIIKWYYYDNKKTHFVKYIPGGGLVVRLFTVHSKDTSSNIT